MILDYFPKWKIYHLYTSWQKPSKQCQKNDKDNHYNVINNNDDNNKHNNNDENKIIIN